MSPAEVAAFIQKVILEIDKLIPEYLNDPKDKSISEGHAAVCIIDEDGNIHGKMWGTNKNRTRQTFRVAWTKSSQVWITGMKTGEYERKVFNNEIDDSIHGIQRPDLIGWEGGQPITLKDGTVLSAGFSGFRGVSDLEIVRRAISKLEL